MLRKDLNGVEIDLCPSCRGIWLDEGELRSICGLDPSVGRILTCPKCDHEMHVKTVDGVEIDICPGCSSIYLDRGELEKLSGVDPQTGEPVTLSTYFEREFLMDLQRQEETEGES